MPNIKEIIDGKKKERKAVNKLRDLINEADMKIEAAREKMRTLYEGNPKLIHNEG